MYGILDVCRTSCEEEGEEGVNVSAPQFQENVRRGGWAGLDAAEPGAILFYFISFYK